MFSTVQIELKPTLINPKMLKQLQNAGNYRVEWCRKVCNFMLRTLRDVSTYWPLFSVV